MGLPGSPGDPGPKGQPVSSTWQGPLSSLRSPKHCDCSQHPHACCYDMATTCAGSPTMGNNPSIANHAKGAEGAAAPLGHPGDVGITTKVGGWWSCGFRACWGRSIPTSRAGSKLFVLFHCAGGIAQHLAAEFQPRRGNHQHHCFASCSCTWQVPLPSFTVACFAASVLTRSPQKR